MNCLRRDLGLASSIHLSAQVSPVAALAPSIVGLAPGNSYCAPRAARPLCPSHGGLDASSPWGPAPCWPPAPTVSVSAVPGMP